jgi:hypothetical protein
MLLPDRRRQKTAAQCVYTRSRSRCVEFSLEEKPKEESGDEHDHTARKQIQHLLVDFARNFGFPAPAPLKSDLCQRPHRAAGSRQSQRPSAANDDGRENCTAVPAPRFRRSRVPRERQPDHGRDLEEIWSRFRPLGVRSQRNQPAAARGSRTITPAHSGFVRAGRDSWLPHDFSRADCHGLVMGYENGRSRPGDCGSGGSRGGNPVDVRPHGGHRARCALGTDGRRRGRRSFPRGRDGAGPGAGISRQRTGCTRPGASVRQAFRRIRRRRWRTRLRFFLHPGRRNVEHLPATVQGRAGRRRRQRNERLHGSQRCAGQRQSVAVR